MALVAFRRIQIGKESTRGTLVAADKKLLGTLTATPDVTFHRPIEERNSLAEYRRAIATNQITRMRFDGGASYDQLIYFLAMAVKGAVAGAQQAATPAYLWTYTPSLTAKAVQDSFTFEYGDDTQEFECGFALIDNLELNIALGEVVNLRADMFAKLLAKSTFTGGLSDPTNFEEIVSDNLKVYIDGTYANLGTTQKSTLVSGGRVRLATGLVPVKYADGGLDFSGISEGKRHLEIELDMIVGSDFITEYDAYIAGTERSIRLIWTGTQIDPAPHYYTLTVDAIGRYTSPPELFGDRDGENMARLTFASHEDASGNEYSIVVKNQETAL